MKIVTPYARLVGPDLPTDTYRLEDGIQALRRIEYFGRISHRSEEAQTDDSWRRFIPATVVGHGDYSIIEHIVVTVDAVHDRGVQQEWTRHRHQSPTIESTRFVNYEKKMPASFVEPPDMTDDQREEWVAAMTDAENHYKQMIRKGAAPQIARSCFPLGLASRMVFTGNLRAWRHLMIMRTTKETHPQFRQIAIPLLLELQGVFPYLFDDIIPMMRQIDNLRLPR